MATSDSTDFSENARDLIEGAQRLLGVKESGEPATAAQLKDGLSSLNMMIKTFGTDAHLWIHSSAILFLEVGKESYTIPGDRAVSSFTETTTSADAVATDTTVELTSVEGISGPPDLLSQDPATSTNGWTTSNVTLAIVDNELESTSTGTSFTFCSFALDTTVGEIYLVDLSYVKGTSADAKFSMLSTPIIDPPSTVTLTATGTATLEFTATSTTSSFIFQNESVAGKTNTLASLNYRIKSAGDVIGFKQSATAVEWNTVAVIDGTTVTLNSALVDDVDSGSTVFSYPTSNLIGRPLKILNAQRFVNTIDTPITILSEDEYFDLPSKGSQGIVTQLYFDAQRTTSTLFTWPTTSTIDDVIKFRYQRIIEDFDSAVNDPDFPQEWLEMLKYNLAVRMAPEYGVRPLPEVISMAVVLLNVMTSFDDEDVPVFFQPTDRHAS